MLSVLGAVAAVAFVPVYADDANGGVSCAADKNSNGVVDRSEVIAVIRAYFNQTSCLPADTSDWTVSLSEGNDPEYTVLSKEESNYSIGPWWLSVQCIGEGRVAVLMGTLDGPIYNDTEQHQVEIVADLDGDVSALTWLYLPGSDRFGDWLASLAPVGLAESLLTTDEVTLTVPTARRQLCRQVFGVRTGQAH